MDSAVAQRGDESPGAAADVEDRTIELAEDSLFRRSDGSGPQVEVESQHAPGSVQEHIPRHGSNLTTDADASASEALTVRETIEVRASARGGRAERRVGELVHAVSEGDARPEADDLFRERGRSEHVADIAESISAGDDRSRPR